MPDRRSVVLALAASALASEVRALDTPVTMLWPDAMPGGGGGPTGSLARDIEGAVSHVATPCLDVFTPDHPNGVAVLVAGGGGYTRIGMVKEAYPAADWLVSQGVTAFVLTYRLPQEGWHDTALAPLQDAQRAVRTIRAQADRYRLDPQRIGVMGFSAGGHLLGMAAARPDFQTYRPFDRTDAVSSRPDFASLIYPVVSLQPPYDRTTTRHQLVGESPSPEASAAWSLQPHIRATCPPTFLVQADDDRVISSEHSRILDAACRSAGVTIEYHRFATGGHGFGIGRSDTPIAAWRQLWRGWLSGQGILR